MDQPESKSNLNRRKFLKFSGLAGAVLGSAGIGVSGYKAGKDPETYSGLQSYEGADQSFDRTDWEVDTPTYQKAGPTRRADARTEVIFNRRARLGMQYTEGIQPGDLDDVLKEYYREHREDFELDVFNKKEIAPKLREDSKKYDKKYIIAKAWATAMGAVSPRPVSRAPEISDFPINRRTGKRAEPLGMVSPEKTAKLIKQIAHELGSTLVGLTKLNPDWVYLYPNRQRGFALDKPVDVPKHWKYAIVVGTPMSWDPLYASPNYSASNDAYSRSRIVAFRLTSFIKQLGYAARPHYPGTSYDLMVPPVCVDAGLGEQGRHGILITPELGSNFRPAVVTTNLPVKTDKPIDIGVQQFCKRCKVCAENCPSGAITTEGKVKVRGYRRYQINQARCHNFWNSNLGNYGCRICVAVCPYTRKANWLHRTALNLSLHDPTGISDRMLVSLQKLFYPGPDPSKYYIPSFGGENASYREPPWWLRTEDFIEI